MVIADAPSVEMVHEDPVELAAVKQWLARIKRAKAKWDADFQRMRENQKFASGLQWENQKTIRDPDGRYTCNLVLRNVAQKVAHLYARNPEAEALPRKRLDFAIWDGTIPTLQDGFMRMAQGDVQAVALLQDFTQGRKMQRLVEQVCKTLDIVYQYQVDNATPDFKEQMKQLVRRVITCGVGYCIPSFVREGYSPLSTVEASNDLGARAKAAKLIIDKLANNEIQQDDAAIETLKSLMMAMNGQRNTQSEEFELSERLEFDFPPATSIIPDERCRSLKGFVNARWIAQEFVLPADEINAFFNLSGDDAVKVTTENIDREGWDQSTIHDPDLKNDPVRKPMVTFYRVFDQTTKCDFYVAVGHRVYLRGPELLDPVSGFWPVFALTFNDIESEEGAGTSIFPPSDVELMLHPQKEWNRSREALRGQRNANAPTYLTRKGVLTDGDKENLQQREPNEVIELEGVPADKRPSEVVEILQSKPIDPAVYTTSHLEQDIQLGTGAQQADLGNAQKDVTATVGTIAEQSRVTVSSSNVDDLDCFLSAVARACSEMLIRNMSTATVKRIAGPGAAWPEFSREDFLNGIEMTVKAASSGRPNKALDTANAERLMPLLLNAGANPIAVIEELVKRMDDRLDPAKFFPIPGIPPMLSQPQASASGSSPAVGGAQARPQQPNPSLPDVAPPVPLTAG